MRRVLPMLFLIAACPAPPTSRPAPPPTSRPVSPPASRPASAPTSRPASLLQRRDPPPPGIAPTREGFLLGGFAWSSCPLAGYGCVNSVCTRPTSLEILTVLRTVSVLEPIEICAVGFGPPVAFEIRSPAGQTRRTRVTTGEEIEAIMVLPPGPPGTYTVTVTQGSKRLTKTLQVSAADKPRVRLHPHRAAPGTRVHLALVGFGPNKRVGVRLYGPVPLESAEKDELPKGGYITTLELSTSAEGQAEREVETDRSDPPGYYFFLAGPAEAQLELRPDE
jgi:hypothetical protein